MQTLPYEFDAESTAMKSMIFHGQAIEIDDDMPSPEPRPSSSSSAALSPDPTVLEESPAGEMVTPPHHLFGPNIKAQVMSPTGPWPRYEDMCDSQPEDMSTPEIYRQEKAAEDLKLDQYLADLKKPAGEVAQVREPSGDVNDDEIPIVTRREQWGTDAKSLAADAGEEPDADYDPTTPDANDAAPSMESLPKAKAKSNSETAAKAKAKATATAKAKAKARAKARREELREEKKAAKEARIKETKARAKRVCTVRPGASAESSPPEDEHVPGEIPSSSEPSKPVDEVQPMEVDAECNQGEGKSEEKARGKGESFAGRYMPQAELKATKYQAIRDTFVQSLSARLQPQYKFQDKGLLVSQF